MPTDLNQFAPWKSATAFVRALEQISTANGYNTTPTVRMGAVARTDLAEGEFPHIAVEMGDMAPAGAELGGVSQGLVRLQWEAFVWGHVKTSGHRRELYEAASALLVDVFAAVWANETLPDANGAGTTIFVLPGEIIFDVESFATENYGYFLAEFGLVADIVRGSAP